MAPRSSPLTPASASRSNSRPSTEASVRSRLHASERWRRRRPITSLTLCGIASGAVAGSLQASLRGEQPHDLADEQRVALGLGVHRRSQLRCGRAGRGELDEVGDVGLAEAGERERPRDRLASQLGEGRRERIRQGRIDVAVRADDQQAAVAELAGDELEKQERGLVCRVQVVEHQHQRPRGRRALQEGGHGIEEPEARSLGLERRRRRQIGEEVAELGKQLGHVGGSLAKLGAKSSPRRYREGTAAATAPRASRRGRRPPPSSGRPAPARRALWRVRSAPRRGGSCRYRARRRAGTAVRGRRRRHRDPRRARRARARGPQTRCVRCPTADSAAAGSCRRQVESRGPARVSPARARVAARPARCPAPRPASCARPGRPAARRPGGRERYRASISCAAQALSVGMLADQRLELRPPPRRGRRAPASPRSAARAPPTRRSSSRAISRCANGS